MREDAVLLLDELNIALSAFAKDIKQGKDTDIVYGEYLKGLLLHTAHNYKILKNKTGQIPDIPYKTLFVILPGNVPMVFFEVLPVSIVYRIKTFFKFPEDEKNLYSRFISYLNVKHPEIGKLFDGSYLSHIETEKIIREYDFLFAFGSDKLKDLLSKTPVPYRFFGPGFSFGITFDSVNKEILKDVLFFDQRGCLSMKFLFYTEEHIVEYLKDIFREADYQIPPTSIFNKDRFDYRLYSLIPYGEIILKNDKNAIFEINSPIIPDIPLPERTLILKRINEEEDIIEFLGNHIHRVQAIATDNPNKVQKLREYAAFITEFGKLQFQPYNFFFKKGVTLENIFWR